jgi:hypothetical protein
MLILINKLNTAITKKQQRERVNETKQFCEVKTHKTENNYPQPIVGKQAASVWFSIRDND